MAATHNRQSTLMRVLDILRYERKEISAIYFYVILGGIVQLTLPLGIQSIISYVLGGVISTSLIILIVLVILGVLAAGILQINSMKYIERIQQQLFVRYSFKYAHALPRLDLQSVDGYYLPELTNRFFDTLSLQKSMSKVLLDIPTATIQILFGLILLSFYHPVFIAFGILLILVLYLMLRFTGGKGISTSIEESNYKYKVAAYLQELARTVMSFKFTGKRIPHLQRIDGYVTGYLNARTSHFKVLKAQYWTLIIFKVLVTAAMLIAGSILLVSQQISVGQFIAAEIIILLLMGSVEKLIMSLDKIYDALTAVEKVSKLIDKPQEHEGAIDFMPNTTGIALQLRNVSFGYNNNKQQLHEISMDIPAGGKVFIRGSYGSGKSSLLRLLSGSYPAYEGTFIIDGNPLRSYNLSSYREHVGLKLNLHQIFEGTLWENITMCDEDADRKYISRLAEVTGLSSFAQQHPEGYEMQLHPAGQHLPGRIIKKILLVRALAHKPKLILLEEPWQDLDATHAASIQSFLLEELRDTTLIISGSKIENANRYTQVYELSNGHITQTL